MSKLADYSINISKEMKENYLQGVTLQQIAEKYDVSTRSVYYRIQPLSKEEKLEHLRRRMDRENGNNSHDNTHSS